MQDKHPHSVPYDVPYTMADGNLENPAHLSPRIAELFPSRVVAVELTVEAPRSVLTEVELKSISHCANKRIDDFTRGRACARRGLRELGVEGFSLLSGDKREPLWPQDIVGSITHTTGFAAAVVAHRAQVQSLGIDCEVIESVGEDLWERICTPQERERLAQLSEAQARRQAALIFAAKEAFYKCQFPLSREWVGFEDVSIEIHDDGTLRIVPEVRLPVAAEWVAALRAAYHYRGQWAVTGVAAPHCS
ncbi:MAG: 4'-phosphopantetheinyl transferase superfamily protein [Proteobacteria bacterium]|nr:4'-phosphopantetheinyl transferase superfamily protein [Pseudomonadota bacterium]